MRALVGLAERETESQTPLFPRGTVQVRVGEAMRASGATVRALLHRTRPRVALGLCVGYFHAAQDAQ